MRIKVPGANADRSARLGVPASHLAQQVISADHPALGLRTLGAVEFSSPAQVWVQTHLILSVARSFPREALENGCLEVDVLDWDLETIEGTGLGDLGLVHEPTNEVLQRNFVGGNEEGEDTSDEVLPVGSYNLAPVAEALKEIDLPDSPKQCEEIAEGVLAAPKRFM
ncbi:hypothetical protein U1Q18_016474 [Sarracenia purpurea var. burkii]